MEPSVVFEVAMLFTPYPNVFDIPLTTRFVVVTVAAHAVFGVGLGFAVRWLSCRSVIVPPVTSGAAA
jgi:hypothetical protein